MKGVKSSVHLGIIRLEESNSKSHKKVFKFLRDSGIGVQLHYLPVHLQPYYQNLGFREGMFPAAEKYSKKSFSIPLFPTLKESEQDFIK